MAVVLSTFSKIEEFFAEFTKHFKPINMDSSSGCVSGLKVSLAVGRAANHQEISSQISVFIRIGPL